MTRDVKISWKMIPCKMKCETILDGRVYFSMNFLDHEGFMTKRLLHSINDCLVSEHHQSLYFFFFISELFSVAFNFCK